jgi:hypothetical protein
MARLLTLVVLLACGGCATVLRGTTDQVQILSEPTGAQVRTSLNHACVTPCTITVSRKDEFVVSYSKPGYRSVEIPVKTAVQTAGGGAFVGNVVAGGIVGMGTDMATGAANDHVPNPVMVELEPDTPGAPPRREPKPTQTSRAPEPAPTTAGPAEPKPTQTRRAPGASPATAAPAEQPAAATTPIASTDTLRN